MKKSKNNFEISDSQKIMIGVLGIFFSFIFLILSLFFQLQSQNFEFVIFLTVSFWLLSVSLAINFTKLLIKSFLYTTSAFVLLVLPFIVSIPFVITSAKQTLIITICIDFAIGFVLSVIFAYCVLILPRHKKIKFLSDNQKIINQSNEIQTTFESIFFNEKGDRALIIKVNAQKFITRIEKLIEGGYYLSVSEHFDKSILNAKVTCFKELILLSQDNRKNLTINIELPKNEKLKNYMQYFNKELKNDGIDERFLTNSFYSTYYKKEYIYLTNQKDKSFSIEIFEEMGSVYFCLLGVREILPNNIEKEEIYEIIKMVLQGKLIYVLNKRKTNLTNIPIYDAYDLRKLNNMPILLKYKILFSKNSKTWTGVTAKEYLLNQNKLQKTICDVDFYCDALNQKFEDAKICEKFVIQKKLIKGKLRKCLHVSNKTNLIKQADIYVTKNQLNFKFVFSYVTSPLLLDFDANVEIMFDFTSHLFLDKVVFHYKLTPDGRMYEKGMFLLDSNNEFKSNILSYLQNSSQVKLMVWSDLDNQIILNKVNEIFK